MSTPRQRSYEGCWTCKTKRRKCDKTRPICRNCQQRGIRCEGYEVRLRWGTGIASRGHFTGADKPVGDSVPARPKGRRRDLEKNRDQGAAVEQNVVEKVDDIAPQELNLSHDPIQTSHEHQQSSGGTLEDDRLFRRFLDSGINILHSTAVNDGDNMLPPRLPQLCEESEALYAICLAFQTSLSKGRKSRFFEYFDAALGKFRVELASSVSHLGDATLTAGLLLCSLGFMHGLPWTMHIQGMHNILQIHGLDYPPGQLTPFRTHLIEVLGIMDLPTFSIGRQNPCIGIWRSYCRKGTWVGGQHPDRSEVEVVSGLPRSLIDIFSCIGAGASEEDFWNWPGAEGNLLQCQLWEAYRLAGMLILRHLQLSPESSLQPQKLEPPKTVVLVTRILSCVDAIRRASLDPEQKGSLIMNAIHYPVFVAGLEVGILSENIQWKQLIRECFTSNTWRTEFGEEDRILLELIEELWELNDESVDVDELARARGMELGLM